MSTSYGINGVQTSLPKGYATLTKNKHLINAFKKEFPGELEKVAETIDSEMANALMAVRVEDRFSKQKDMLDKLENDLANGVGKDAFANLLNKAESVYDDVVTRPFKDIVFDNQVMTQKVTKMVDEETVLDKEKLEDTYKDQQEEISNNYNPGFYMPGEILKSDYRRSKVAANYAEPSINSSKVAKETSAKEFVYEKKEVSYNESTDIKNASLEDKKNILEKNNDVINHDELVFNDDAWKIKKAQLLFKNNKLSSWYLNQKKN